MALVVNTANGFVSGHTYIDPDSVWALAVRLSAITASNPDATKEYSVTINGQLPITIVGLSNLTTFLAKFGLTWS